MNKRQLYNFPLPDAVIFKKQLRAFYKLEKYMVFLESNHSNQKYDSYQTLVGVGYLDGITCKSSGAFDQLEVFKNKHNDWMFGFLGYDLKNELEGLNSAHKDILEFPDLCFFVPKLVFEISECEVSINAYNITLANAKKLVHDIQNHHSNTDKAVRQKIALKALDTKEAYLQKAQSFLKHIYRGDIYEANFCTQFYAHQAHLNPQVAFNALNSISEPPFAVYARFKDHYVICASPERYLKKKGSKLISQPIKGTAKRSSDPIQDEVLKERLFNDPKERSENVMIVDLVRNDLSKTAVKGSVKVEELFGIYTFKQVHHMISTISATLCDQYRAIDAIKTTFPMGSMTGAPKISAMNIIEENESFKRGLYSGAIGYFTPAGDFDFNVVIRTILYNEKLKTLSFAVGSAITAAAIPEKEFEECFLKARALIEVLARQGIVMN
jgi:para-aminobenzoate synthetase component 1